MQFGSAWSSLKYVDGGEEEGEDKKKEKLLVGINRVWRVFESRID